VTVNRVGRVLRWWLHSTGVCFSAFLPLWLTTSLIAHTNLCWTFQNLPHHLCVASVASLGDLSSPHSLPHSPSSLVSGAYSLSLLDFSKPAPSPVCSQPGHSIPLGVHFLIMVLGTLLSFHSPLLVWNCRVVYSGHFPFVSIFHMFSFYYNLLLFILFYVYSRQRRTVFQSTLNAPTKMPFTHSGNLTLQEDDIMHLSLCFRSNKLMSSHELYWLSSSHPCHAHTHYQLFTANAFHGWHHHWLA